MHFHRCLSYPILPGVSRPRCCDIQDAICLRDIHHPPASFEALTRAANDVCGFAKVGVCTSYLTSSLDLHCLHTLCRLELVASSTT